jgi:type III restriction enzyme
VQLRNGLPPSTLKDEATARFHGRDGNGHGQDLRLPAQRVRAEPALWLHQVRGGGALRGDQGRREQDAADHPRAFRGPVPAAKGYEFFQYDSDKLGQVRNFATSPNIQIMVITVGAINKFGDEAAAQAEESDEAKRREKSKNKMYRPARRPVVSGRST